MLLITDRKAGKKSTKALPVVIKQIMFHQVGFHECKDKQCNRFHKLFCSVAAGFHRLLGYICVDYYYDYDDNDGVETAASRRHTVKNNTCHSPKEEVR